MKKVLSYICIVFGLIVMAISTSRTAMQFITEHRDGDKWWDSYPCLHGDLVSLSYLDFVPAFNAGGAAPLKRAGCAGNNNISVVLHGDSYTWHLSDTNFSCVSSLYYINRTNGGSYRLEHGKRNILVIEVSERYLRSYFGGTQIFNEVHDTGSGDKNALGVYVHCLEASLLPLRFHDLFNKYINQNLQCNLFNYNFIMPMFEYKAALNYYVFNRASGDVVISDDRKRLFLRETVEKTGSASSYSPISDEEVNQIVATLNTIDSHYRKAGFDDVYFSAIPNPATVMQPDGYNELIPRVQNNQALKMKVIDIYSIFKTSTENYYLPGDTHWNARGKQRWIDEVNKILNEDNQRK